LTPEQSETLVFLEDRAVLKLILRPSGDPETVSLPPREESDLMSRLGRSPSRNRSVEIIRGPESLPKGNLP